MKKTILRLLLIVLVVACIAVGGFFLLRGLGFTSVDDFTRLRDDLGDGTWFWVIIVALQVFQAIVIQCSNSLISAPIAIIFNQDLWKVFLASWLGIVIGNIALYYIGRFCGGKLLKFVLGDEKKANRMKEFMNSGKSFYLLGCVIPFIPSDVLNVLAGTAGYNSWFVIISTIITRGICAATTIFLVGLIPSHPWLIAVLAVLIVFMIWAAWYVTKRSLKR